MTKLMKAYDCPDETTILKVGDTRFRMDVFLQDVEHLYEAKETASGYVYGFSCHAFTHMDHQRLLELLESAKLDIEFGKEPWSKKVGDSSTCTNKRGEFVFSQLFSPMVTTNLQPWELVGKQASIAGHLRDDPLGRIYLQCEYLDVYDVPDGVSDPEDQRVIVSDDFDW